MSGAPIGPEPQDNQSSTWEEMTWEERYHRLDRETSAVEALICMRTQFVEKSHQGTPYVGWTGLALALREELDERDELRNALAAAETLLAEISSGATQVNEDLARAAEVEEELHRVRLALGDDYGDDPVEVIRAWRRVVEAARDLAAVFDEQDGMAAMAPVTAAEGSRQVQEELRTRYYEARQRLQDAVVTIPPGEACVIGPR